MGYILIVRENVKSNRKDKISEKLVFKTKEPYTVMKKATPSSYWLQHLPFFRFYGGLEER